MAMFLMIVLVACGVLAVVFFLLALGSDSITGWQIKASAACGAVAFAAGIAFTAAGSYIAGQGDAPGFAKEWAAKWAPGAEVECQARDSDSNGYVSCTVGTPGGKIEAIECGVNRWYQGWRTTGCRLMKGYSGSQP